MGMNVYIGGKAEFSDGSKWNLLYLTDQGYSNLFPLEFSHSEGNGAFVLSEDQTKRLKSVDFVTWFISVACSGLYIGEPEKGGPNILTKLTRFDIDTCRGACKAVSASGRFMCSLKETFECEALGYSRGLGKTTSYLCDRSSALVEFRIAAEKGGPLQDPRHVLFSEWSRIFNDVSMKEERNDGA